MSDAPSRAGYVDELIELALAFCPEAERRRCRALLGLRREILAAAAASAESAVCEARIAWWASELGRLPGDGASHPAAIEVARAMPVTTDAVEHLREWCVEAGNRVRGEWPDSPELFAIWAFRRHGALFAALEFAAASPGQPGDAAIDAARDAGHACAVLEAVSDDGSDIEPRWLTGPAPEADETQAALRKRLAAERPAPVSAPAAASLAISLIAAVADHALARIAAGRAAPGRFALLWRAWRTALSLPRRET